MAEGYGAGPAGPPGLAALAMLALLLTAPTPGSAQPATDIFLARLAGRAGGPAVDSVRDITRRPGYDNQPFFTPDGSGLLYTSIRDDGQADTYRYDLAAGTTRRVTRTPESEYSPTVMPDGRHFSAVRVEMDSTQRLWQFDLDGGEPTLLLPNVRPVGYHAWADSETVALYVLGDPSTLRLAHPGADDAVIVARHVGRSLHRVPGRRAISFVDQSDEAAWWIRELDVETKSITAIAPTLPKVEDYAWTPDGRLLAGRGSTLYVLTPGQDRDWRPLADLAGSGLREITRIAVSPDGRRVAIVAADPGAEPRP